MTELVDTVIERFVSGTYMDISSYVVGDIEIDYLISQPDEDVKLASVGRMSMTVDNKTGNFSPNTSFQRGTKIRVRTLYDGVYKNRFIGTIRNLYPDTLEWGDQYVRVECVDWMQYAVDYPSIVLTLQASGTVPSAMAYLLSLMSVQPESVTYYGNRETFDFVFDNTRKATQIYTEMSRLALSEFAPIYLRGGNVLVVESANTRKGTNTLTQVPKAPSQLHAILTDPNGGLILTIEGTNYAILADEAITPNLATGTIQPIDIEIENGGALTNRVITKTYPTRTDASPVLLFQLDHAISINAFGVFVLRGNYADPNGGAPISGFNFSPVTTGTSYVFTNKTNTVDQSTQLIVTTKFGSQSFEHTIFNGGSMGVLRQFNIYGQGIYPYNPVSNAVSATGSISSYSISEMTIDQRYQDDVNAGYRIAEMVVDDEKNPRNRLMSVTFDPSQSSDLMQASQYMDSGDLTWIKNAKPALDTYAYLRGKKTVISPAGYLTETWYLKETDSFQKGLSPLGLNYSGVSGSTNALTVPSSTHLNNLTQRTYSAWVYPKAFSILGHMLISKATEFSGDLFWLSLSGTFGKMQYNGLFSSPAIWQTAGTPMQNLTGTWAHVCLTMDASDYHNAPQIYVNGTQQLITTIQAPSGTMVDDSPGVFIIGNAATRVQDYLGFALNSVIKDVRVYNRILQPSEIADLASHQNTYTNVPDGLVLQLAGEKTEDIANFLGLALTSDKRVIDNVYGTRALPSYSPTGTGNYQLFGVDPTLSSY